MEYMVERFRRLLAVWDPYMGWTRIVGVEITHGEAPIGPDNLSEAMATLPPTPSIG
jgi:hypothetical protein